MFTYWLTGMKHEFGSNQASTPQFSRLIDPCFREVRRHSEPLYHDDKRRNSGQLQELNNQLPDVQEQSGNHRSVLKNFDEIERKISFADSGISMDKGSEETTNIAGKIEHITTGERYDSAFSKLDTKYLNGTGVVFHPENIVKKGKIPHKSNLEPVSDKRLQETHEIHDTFLNVRKHHNSNFSLDNISEHSEHANYDEEHEALSEKNRKNSNQMTNIIASIRL